MYLAVEEINTKLKYILMTASSVSFRPVYTGQDIVGLLLIKTHVLEPKEFPIVLPCFCLFFLFILPCFCLIRVAILSLFFLDFMFSQMK